MVTKGIIKSIDLLGNTCTVHIPFFETAGNDPIIETATVSNTPGNYNGYKVGDVVYVAFEDGSMSTPVIIGKLYLGVDKESSDPRGVINVEESTSAKKATLPADAKLKSDIDKNSPNTLNPFSSLSSIASELNNLNSNVGQMNRDYGNRFKQIISSSDNIKTTIEQTNNRITAEASRLDASIGSLSTTITQTADKLVAKASGYQTDDNGNFIAGEDGKPIQKGFGWNLTADGWTIFREDEEEKIVNVLQVNEDGLIVSGEIDAESGHIGAFKIGQKIDSTDEATGNPIKSSAIYSDNYITTFDTEPKNKGIYLGTDGIKLGKNFEVDAKGNVVARGLTIAPETKWITPFGDTTTLKDTFDNAINKITAVNNLATQVQTDLVTVRADQGALAAQLDLIPIEGGDSIKYTSNLSRLINNLELLLNTDLSDSGTTITNQIIKTDNLSVNAGLVTGALVVNKKGRRPTTGDGDGNGDTEEPGENETPSEEDLIEGALLYVDTGEEEGSKQRVRIGGFEVTEACLYAGTTDPIKLEEGENLTVDLFTNKVKNGVYLGNDGIAIGTNFKVTTGDTGKVTISDYTKSIEKRYCQIDTDDFMEAANSYKKAWTDWDSNIWQSTIPSRIDGKYIWEWTRVEKGDGTFTDNKVCITGATGATGASINEVIEYYLASDKSSDIQVSTSGWTNNPNSSNAQLTSNKKYLWNYEEIKDSNGTTINTTTPCIIGMYSKDGEEGRGIANITNYYLTSPNNSGISNDSGGWNTTPTATDSTNKYLWSYELITYTKGSPLTEKTTAHIIGTHGRSVLSTTKYYTLATSVPTIPTTKEPTAWNTTSKTGWSTTPPSFVKNYNYYESIRTIYNTTVDGKDFSWSTPIMNSMLTVEFINSLGITAQKLEVTSAQGDTIFCADSIKPDEVKLGKFLVDNNSISLQDANGNKLGQNGTVMISTGSPEKASIGGSELIDGWTFTSGTNFGVTTNGNLYATNCAMNNGTFEGDITANGGQLNSTTLTNSTLVNTQTISFNNDYSKLSVGSLGESFVSSSESIKFKIYGKSTLMESSNGTFSIYVDAYDTTDKKVLLGSSYSVLGGKAIATTEWVNTKDTSQTKTINFGSTYKLTIAAQQSTVSISKIASYGNSVQQEWRLQKITWSDGTESNFSSANAIVVETKTLSILRATGKTGLLIGSSVAPDINSTTNLYDLGTNTNRWNAIYTKNLYNSVAAVADSDLRNKQNINEDLEKYNDFFDRLKPVAYQFKENNDGITHLGFIAQDVDSAITASNLNRADCGILALRGEGFNSETNEIIDETSTHYGLRYSELHALEVQQIQLLKKQVTALETQVAQLTEQLKQLTGETEE